MGRLIPLLFLVDVALVAIALISCLSAEDDEIRTLPRFGWVLVILFLPLVGAIAWFVAGRPLPANAVTPQLGTGPGTDFRGPSGTERPRPRRRPVAPDDDPEFLRSLDTDRVRRDRELFSQWEDDLGRRDRDPGSEDPPG